MDDMPKSAIQCYKAWINSFPESWDLRDLERFYMFVHVFLRCSKKERNSSWLRNNLIHDCKKLSFSDIEKYCDLFDHLQNFKNVWKTQQARLILYDKFQRSLANARDESLK